MVRAKFTCVAINPAPGNDGKTIAFYPVVSGSEENAQFYKYTPGGGITMSTVNKAASAQFSVGKEYYVDFTEA